MDRTDTLGNNLDDRDFLVRLLRLAGVSALSAEGLESAFIQGAHDPRIEDLHMDSLASMELCILIENHYGVSIAPDRLVAHGSLSGLLETILRTR